MYDHEATYGMPTASGLERIRLCPGSWKLEKNQPDYQSDVAETGDRIHAALAGEIDEADLSEAELETLTKCEELEKDIVTTFCEYGEPDKVIREERLYLRKGIKPIFSGKADVLYIWGSIGLILDDKTGHGEVADAPENDQLKSLAVLAAHNYKLDKIYVGIVRPYSGKREVPVQAYYRDELEEEEAQIRNDVQAAILSEEYVPGAKQCRYCKAKTVCPAIKKEMQAVAAYDSIDLSKVGNNELAALIKDRVPLAKMLCDALEKEAFERLVENPDCMAGLVTLDVSTPRISDAEKLWQEQWLANNDMMTATGRAKKGARAKSEAASKAAFAPLVATKSYERQFWKDRNDAAEQMQKQLPGKLYRRVAGKLKPVIDRANDQDHR